MKERFALSTAVKDPCLTALSVHGPDDYAMLMSPNKGETSVHGCRCPVDVAVHMREVLAIPWLGICVPLL